MIRLFDLSKAAVLALTLAGAPASATTVKIHQICDAGWLASGDLPSSQVSALNLTVQLLESTHTPFIGGSDGIVSIGGTPHGDEALEVISDESMRAYGWCYEVDGMQPGAMPFELILSGTEREVTWFYAYSSYHRGEWLDYCVPVYSTRPSYICGSR